MKDSKKQFVVITTQRSGSNMLRTFISSHKELHCEIEIPFNQKFIHAGLNKEIDGVTSAEDLPSKLKRFPVYEQVAIEQYYHLMKPGNGFVVHYNQLQTNTNISDMNVIHLLRNPFTRAISCITSNNKLREHGHVEIESDKKIDKNRTFSIPKKDLLTWIEKTKSEQKIWIEKIEREAKSYLHIRYESLFNEGTYEMPEEQAQNICAFLNVERQPLHTGFKKINPANYHNYIKNWDVIKKYYADTY